jgi:hypothetical protein
MTEQKAVKSDASLGLCRSRWPKDAAAVSSFTWLHLLFIMVFSQAAEVYLKVWSSVISTFSAFLLTDLMGLPTLS